MTQVTTRSASRGHGCSARQPHRPHCTAGVCGGRKPTALFLLALLLVYFTCASAIVKSSGSGSKSGSTGASSTSSSSSSSRTYVYGKSYGTTVGVGVRLATVLLLTDLVFFHGYTYPGMRFYYTSSYYDDCALRNVTAAQQGLNDATINLATVNALPQLIPDAATTADILTFNQSLYNTTNGLIVDPAYCNYTTTGAAGPGLRWSAGWALALAAVVALCLNGGWCRRDS